MLLTISFLLAHLMLASCSDLKSNLSPDFYEQDFLTHCLQTADTSRRFDALDHETNHAISVNIATSCGYANVAPATEARHRPPWENTGDGPNMRVTCQHLQMPKATSKMSAIDKRKSLSADCGTRLGLFLAKCADRPEKENDYSLMLPCDSNCAMVTAVKSCQCYTVGTQEIKDCYENILVALRSDEWTAKLKEEEASLFPNDFEGCPITDSPDCAAVI